MMRGKGAVADAPRALERRDVAPSDSTIRSEPGQAGVRIDRSCVIKERNDFGAEFGADRPPLAG